MAASLQMSSLNAAGLAGPSSGQDGLYEQVEADYGASLARLSRAYEADPHLRRDLLQDIHLAIWRSLAAFDQRCALRTWIYRVAHNVGATHILRRKRQQIHRLVSLEEVEIAADETDMERRVDESRALDGLIALVHTLQSPDRELFVSYLEGLTTEEIAQITGLSTGNVATKVHRIKRVLVKAFHMRGIHEQRIGR